MIESNQVSGPADYATHQTDPPIAAQSIEGIRGFSWAQDAVAAQGNCTTSGIGGAPIADDAGNIIDAGTDNDWVGAGTGSDRVADRRMA